MITNGAKGLAKSEGINLELISGWDNEEDTNTIGSGDLTLTSGTLGDNSGVGDGASRTLYFCRGIHNPTSSGITVAYNKLTISDGNETIGTAVFKIYIPGGGWAQPLNPIGRIKGTGSGTSASVIKLLYKDKNIVTGAGRANNG